MTIEAPARSTDAVPEQPQPAPAESQNSLPEFSEHEALPSNFWGQKIAREAERSIGNLELRMKVATTDADIAKEDAHIFEMRTGRLQQKHERLEMARDKRADEIEMLKDPSHVLNRFAVTSWINESRVGVKQLRNRFTNWRLGNTQAKLLDNTAKWRDAQMTFDHADRLRLEFAERIDKRVQARLDPINKRLESVDRRVATIKQSIDAFEGVARQAQDRADRLVALKSRATSPADKAAIDALIRTERDALAHARATLQRDLFPRLAKANKHHERTTRAYVFATAAQEKIAARYDLRLHGAPEAQPADRIHFLPSSDAGSMQSWSEQVPLGAPASLDLRKLLAELFPPLKPTVQNVIDSWNKLFGYVAPIGNAEELWQMVVEADPSKVGSVSSMQDDEKRTTAYTMKDWRETLERLATDSPRFRAFVEAAKPKKTSAAEFIKGFLSSMPYTK